LLDAEQRHDESEQATVRAFNKAATLANKYKTEFSRIGQETAAYEQNYWNENKDALQKQGWSYTPDANSAWGGKWSKSSTSVSTPAIAKPALTPKTDWNAKATQYGFKDIDAVKAWQAENGLVADGKFGKDSLAKYNEIAQANQ
jgi:murein L,D-transpeptidase YcbB/YkuD